MFKVDLDARRSAAKASPTPAVALISTPQQHRAFRKDGQPLETMFVIMPQDSKKTSEEATVAETECQRARIKGRPRLHAGNPLEEDTPSLAGGAPSTGAGVSSQGQELHHQGLEVPHQAPAHDHQRVEHCDCKRLQCPRQQSHVLFRPESHLWLARARTLYDFWGSTGYIASQDRQYEAQPKHRGHLRQHTRAWSIEGRPPGHVRGFRSHRYIPIKDLEGGK